MIAANGFAQGVIDVHSHLITPEFVSTLEQYLTTEPDLAAYREMILHFVFRQGESLVQQSSLAFKSRHKLRSDDVAMHIYHTLSKCGCS